MAMSLNKLCLIGNVGTIPTSDMVNATPVAKFNIATNDRKKTASGEWTDEATWHKIVTYGKTAELVLRYVTKGTTVYLEGKQRHRQYTDKSGQTQTWSDVLADRVLLLDKKSDTPDKPLATLDVSKGAIKQASAAFDEDLSDVPF